MIVLDFALVRSGSLLATLVLFTTSSVPGHAARHKKDETGVYGQKKDGSEADVREVETSDGPSGASGRVAFMMPPPLKPDLSQPMRRPLPVSIPRPPLRFPWSFSGPASQSGVSNKMTLREGDQMASWKAALGNRVFENFTEPSQVSQAAENLGASVQEFRRNVEITKNWLGDQFRRVVLKETRAESKERRRQEGLDWMMRRQAFLGEDGLLSALTRRNLEDRAKAAGTGEGMDLREVAQMAMKNLQIAQDKLEGRTVTLNKEIARLREVQELREADVASFQYRIQVVNEEMDAARAEVSQLGEQLTAVQDAMRNLEEIQDVLEERLTEEKVALNELEAVRVERSELAFVQEQISSLKFALSKLSASDSSSENADLLSKTQEVISDLLSSVLGQMLEEELTSQLEALRDVSVQTLKASTAQSITQKLDAAQLQFWKVAQDLRDRVLLLEAELGMCTRLVQQTEMQLKAAVEEAEAQQARFDEFQ